MEIRVGSTPINDPITTWVKPIIPVDAPLYPPSIPGDPAYIEPNKCSKCGITLHPVMGYVCSQNDCPTGMGPRSIC
jgi:hypothetical protein